VEDDVDVWRYAVLELHARNDDDDDEVIQHIIRHFGDESFQTIKILQKI